MKLKFCGLSTLNSLKHACDLGAHYAGFIFADRSPRKVNHEFMDQLASFNFHQTIPVCVFVNPSAVFVEQVIASLPTAILQFHGDESDQFCSQFNKPFWKSVAVKDASSLPLILSNGHPSAQAILLETFSVNLDGGTGQT
ncbi:MAG: phosphoribosylanthranilate isomerase, partial [Gammaproteobacteria bacterium]